MQIFSSEMPRRWMPIRIVVSFLWTLQAMSVVGLKLLKLGIFGILAYIGY